MRLPGGRDAIVSDRKIREYLLSPTHRDGQHKARVFASALGLRAAESKVLEEALRAAAVGEDAQFQEETVYGSIYVVRFQMRHAGRSAMIRSVWIIPSGRAFPELITAIVE